MISKLLFYYLTILCFVNLNAQVNDSLVNAKKNNEYITYYDDYVTTRLGLSNNFNSFKLKDKINNLEYTVTPNQKLKSTFIFIFRFIEIDIAYTPNFIKFRTYSFLKQPDFM
jgi:hypothetical protein